MEVFNVHGAKTQLSRLLDRVAQGEEVIIAKSGRPVAKLVPLTAEPRRPGSLKDCASGLSSTSRFPTRSWRRFAASASEAMVPSRAVYAII
jgi:prevent-host-death family protein